MLKIDLSHIKEGESGDYSISRYIVTPEDIWDQWGSIFKNGRGCMPGKYIKLMRENTLVMSNTSDEIKDHAEFIKKATGSVLINGLGLGMCLTAILNKDDVKDVTVIEISEDVINLVGPSFANDSRVEIVNENAFDYKPPKGKRFNAVWHDIWDYIDIENLIEIRKLHYKYRYKTDWQGSWVNSKLISSMD